MEATTLFLKNGNEEIVFDELYANAVEMKQWLSHYKLRQPLPNSYDEQNAAGAKEIYGETFKGHPVFSLRGLMMWGFIIALLYILTTGKSSTPMAVAFILVACVVWFVAIAF